MGIQANVTVSHINARSGVYFYIKLSRSVNPDSNRS